MCCFYKIKNNGIPSYLTELIPSESHLYNSWNTRNIKTYSCRTDAFKYLFFPQMINKLNFNIWKSSFNMFRANLIKIIQYIFKIFNPLGLKLITRLQFRLSHLNEHRFNYIFKFHLNSFLLIKLNWKEYWYYNNYHYWFFYKFFSQFLLFFVPCTLCDCASLFYNCIGFIYFIL